MCEEIKTQTVEEKKQYLKKYLYLLHKTDNIAEEIQMLRLRKMSPSAQISGMPRSNTFSDLSDYAALVDSKIQELKIERYLAMKLYIEIKNQINLIEDENEREVLRLKYILGHTWEEVCERMGYSWRQIHRIHNKALEHFKMA